MDKFIKHIIMGMLIGAPFFGHSQERITTKPINISSSASEYAPVYYKGGLVFSNVDPNKSMTGLYFAPFKKEKFGKKAVFSEALKSGLHEGAITFSADGNTAYFTRSQIDYKLVEDSTTQETKLGVFKTTFDGNDWGNITSCNFNTPEFSFGHPSLSYDGTRLYLASDVDGGFGGKDIYYAQITDGVCGPLINLGETVNSKANEFFPSIDPNGNLYFSSDKIGGKGGLDIYLTQLDSNLWRKPDLLDAPINSEFDDFSIVWNQNGLEGYYASNRNGSDDIFKITISNPEFSNCVKMEHAQFCYDFFEESTVGADSVVLIYEWNFGDGVKSNLLEMNHCYEKPGKYEIKLSILDKLAGEEYIETASYDLEIKDIIQPKISLPDTFVVNENFNITLEQGRWVDFEIEDYYIDYGDLIITKNSALNHKYLTTGKKEIKVLIIGRDLGSNEIRLNCFNKIITVNEE